MLDQDFYDNTYPDSLPLNEIYCGLAEDLVIYFPDNSIDFMITDPPAGIAFMGKEWDRNHGGREQWIDWFTGIMEKIIQILKPGAMCLVWAIPRTSHWTATGLENAGFEIRDKIYHLFGTGFPKSTDISKQLDKAAGVERVIIGPGRWNCVKGDNARQMDCLIRPGGRHDETAPTTEAAKLWDGWGSSLKPAAEEWILCMKPCESTFAQNALKHGVAGLNIDAGRIELKGIENHKTAGRGQGHGSVVYSYPDDKDLNPCQVIRAECGQNPRYETKGRWPANVIHDGSEEVLAGFPETVSGGGIKNPIGGAITWKKGSNWKDSGYYEANSGSAARFFYCAKPSRSERGPNNDHPTVKSTKLIEHFLDLLSTPTGGIVIDPFAGSGSILVACKRAGRPFIGFEKDPHNVEIAQRRLDLIEPRK